MTVLIHLLQLETPYVAGSCCGLQLDG